MIIRVLIWVTRTLFFLSKAQNLFRFLLMHSAMRLLYLITFSIITSHCFAQIDTIPFGTDSVTFGKAGFYRVTAPAFTKLNAHFVCGNGFTGYTYTLDSTNSYIKGGYSCMSRDLWDSGRWKIKANGNVILISQRKKAVYQLYKLDDIYFFVPELEAEKFKAVVYREMRKYAKRKPIVLDNKLYTVNHIIGVSLSDKYFTMEPSED